MDFKMQRFAAAILVLCASQVSAQVDVTTYHNDNLRSGQNSHESFLTPANVNSTQFGKLFTVAVDGSVYAQPLVVSNVTVAGAAHNVIYVATQHDSIYAIDADSGRVYWQKSLIPAGGSPVSSGADLNCGDIATEVGITGTPVIDTSTGTLYVVAKGKAQGVISQYLHALDISTAAEKFGGPALIQASVAGTAGDGDGSMVSFNPVLENQRSALLLENGHVVISWAAHCDIAPWHGWVMAYGATSLLLEAAYNASANGDSSGIWMGGSGPAADASGNIFVASGNGSWNGTTNLGDSIVKLGPPANGTFPVLDYFTPYNQSTLSNADTDVGAGGLVLLPNLSSGQQLLALIGKEGKLYLVDRNNMGKFCGTLPGCTSSDPNIVEEIPNAFSGLWGSPAYWNGSLFWAGGNDETGAAEALKAFSFNAGNSGLVSKSPTSSSAKAFRFSGPIPSISSSGQSHGIVWGLDDSAYSSTCSGSTGCQVLYAYDATNLGTLLYSSNQAAGARDVPGSAIKFATPTIANGKVYVGSKGAVSAFGLLNGVLPTAVAPTFNPAAGTYTSSQSVVLSDSTPGAAIYYTLDGTDPTTLSAKYSSAVPISATSTIKALAAATGFTNSPVSSATYVIAAPGTAPVNLSFGTAANVTALVNDGSSIANGGLDGSGNAYSASLLGSSVVWSGSAFALGTPGQPDSVSGGTETVPAGNYSALSILATGAHGNQLNQMFRVTYTDGTTTSIVQSLSDWFTPQNYAGESKVVTMAYRLTGSGKGNGPFYLYGYTFTLNSAKTLKSITWPANRNVIVVAANLVPARTTPPPPPPPPPPGGSTPVSLTGAANVYAIFNDGTPVSNGGVDTFGDAYSAKQLGSTITWSGTSFALGPVGAADAVSRSVVSLPAGSYSSLLFLATGVHGNQPNQTFRISYTDGSTAMVQQSLSDWHTPQGYAGESRAATTAYRLLSNGTSGTGPFYLYGYQITLDPTKTVKSLTLPSNRNVVLLAAFLAASSNPPPPPPPPSGPTAVNLSTIANVHGIGADGTPVAAGGLDGSGDAYTSSQLTASVTWSGTTFTLLGAGIADAVSNTAVPLPAGSFSTLQLLATAVHGNQLNQNFVITYTDGSTSTAQQSLSDWFTPQGFSGEGKAATTAYRLLSNGSKGTGPFYLYGYAFSLDPHKTVKTLTLPGNRNVAALAAELLP